MPKGQTKDFAGAKARSLVRRANADESQNQLKRDVYTEKMILRMTDWCDSQGLGEDTQNTVALGKLQGHLFIAAQHGDVKYDAEEMKGTFVADTIHDCKNRHKGLHAEMMIVQYAVQKLGFDRKLLADLGLMIASTKGCCPDCSGWMNEHRIPHTPCSGKPTNQWMHPLTGSTYEVKKNFKSYTRVKDKTKFLESEIIKWD